VNTVPVPVTITGANFFGVPTAMLGSSAPIAISAATTTTLTGTVPAGLIPGVYALRVTNPDGQFAILSPAYTVLGPDTTLETGRVSTFGTAATAPANGDNDQVQVIFLEVPDTVTDTLYVHIFDPDLGGTLDEQQGAGWDTDTNFSLYGGGGAYADPAARQARFATTGDPGISSGTLIASQTFAVDDPLNPLDGTWYLFATFDPTQGETVGNRRVFKLSVIGANGGDDGNLYNVALSTSGSSPSDAPAGGRIFAYAWTFPLVSGSPRWLYPYVPLGTVFFEQHNWDMDILKCVGIIMRLYTPIRILDVAEISDEEAEASSRYRVDASEDEATWTTMMAFSFPGANDVTFWVVDGIGTPLPIFTRPTTTSPP
jgi:hypothetical protein